MMELEVLIRELVPVDGVAASPVVAYDVASLNYEALDDSGDEGSLVVKTFAVAASSFLPCINTRPDFITFFLFIFPFQEAKSLLPQDYANHRNIMHGCSGMYLCRVLGSFL